MSSSQSRFGVFLDNYNRENKFLQNESERFFQQIMPEQNKIIDLDNGALKEKFVYLNNLITQGNQSGYDKALTTGSFLPQLTEDIIKNENKVVRRSGINIIKSFLNLAKTTRDQQLLNFSNRIAESINAEI